MSLERGSTVVSSNDDVVIHSKAYPSTNLMENHPQWEAPYPTDLILHKETFKLTDDEQEYIAECFSINQLVMQWYLYDSYVMIM